LVVPDVEAYERFLNESSTRIEGVARIKSSFGLKQLKYSTALLLKQTRRERSRVKPSGPIERS
jgi:DNA-binding Lrp family transcriptional regulator